MKATLVTSLPSEGRLMGPPWASLASFLQLEVGDYVRTLAVGEFGQLVGIKGLVVGGLDDGAQVLGNGAAVLGADVRGEAARGTGSLGDLGAQVHGDLVVGLDLGGHGLDTRVLGLRQLLAETVRGVDGRGGEGHALVEVGPDASQLGLLGHQVHFQPARPASRSRRPRAQRSCR
jgi:hypothetical protein